MKRVPFDIIKAAKSGDIEAAEYIKRHFEGYIADHCLQTYIDEQGQSKQYVDEDLRYLAEIAMYAAIFKYQFKDPPKDFQP